VSEEYRVVYVGATRFKRGSPQRGRLGRLRRGWRDALAEEIEGECGTRAADGFRLHSIVPAQKSQDLQGGWTEGVWLFFVRE
jgi:hypothetical protein